jgi:hypothetical protein
MTDRRTPPHVHLTAEQLSPGRRTTAFELPDGVYGSVLLDWEDGRIVGLEVRDASRAAPSDLLAEADDITGARP